ncbi:hypothetical protein DPEC_G00301390 [Dallia pectoralis]|uniref:Uncharacterized protein n=1 Tax=Dallia pectoralis TaxID=75939 RepID=A0ACC2FGQ1_DALPE|nr:hypothetical protein DPEC_G00301390 [Dallia pectoralis]
MNLEVNSSRLVPPPEAGKPVTQHNGRLLHRGGKSQTWRSSELGLKLGTPSRHRYRVEKRAEGAETACRVVFVMEQCKTAAWRPARAAWPRVHFRRVLGVNKKIQRRKRKVYFFFSPDSQVGLVFMGRPSKRRLHFVECTVCQSDTGDGRINLSLGGRSFPFCSGRCSGSFAFTCFLDRINPSGSFVSSPCFCAAIPDPKNHQDVQDSNCACVDCML